MVDAIAEISAIVERINEIQQSIAGAVEEQTVTAADMARTINDASGGVQQIATSMGTIAEAAKQTAGNASSTQDAANALQQLAQQLAATVQKSS